MASDGDTGRKDRSEESEGSEPKPEEASSVSWGKAGMAGVLGFEFVGLLVAGLFVGYYIDQYFQTSPVGMLVGLGLGLVAAGLHIWRVAMRLIAKQSDAEP